ncbi:hypothetical protein FJY71_06700 [candidate division WOR-3 bacterium]|nr:hypothetical protein [candidate division WOR-3 bacterium]
MCKAVLTAIVLLLLCGAAANAMPYYPDSCVKFWEDNVYEWPESYEYQFKTKLVWRWSWPFRVRVPDSTKPADCLHYVYEGNKVGFRGPFCPLTVRDYDIWQIIKNPLSFLRHKMARFPFQRRVSWRLTTTSGIAEKVLSATSIRGVAKRPGT